MSLVNSIIDFLLTSSVCVCVLVYPTHLHWAADTLAKKPPTPWAEAQGPEWVRSNSGHEACSELFHAECLTSCTGTAATHNAAHATQVMMHAERQRNAWTHQVWRTTTSQPKMKTGIIYSTSCSKLPKTKGEYLCSSFSFYEITWWMLELQNVS